MAGSYPDAPSRRMAWDADKTVAFYRTAVVSTSFAGGNPAVELSGAQKTSLNSEANTTMGSPPQNTTFGMHFIFPELREFDGLFVAGNAGNLTGRVETSADTTNGIAGTWNTETTNLADFSVVYPSAHRANITAFARSSIRAMRFMNLGGGGADLQAAHVYGEISPGQTPDRLLFINEATGVEFTLPYDAGDFPRGSSADKTWRIRNNSASLTANNIQYTVEALYLDSASWYTHTLPGGSTYASTQQVTSLAPATTSGLVTTRRIIPGTATLGPHTGRLYLNTDTWT